MLSQTLAENAVAAIRVSTTKQGTEGDSPEAQREQIERFASNRNITIKKLFLFLESASKDQQPMQEAIDYCKDPKHNIQLFIVKSIDRFTRGGSYSYSNLKRQLEDRNVRLIDIYGIIGSHKVNTLEHLGVSYKWSVYDPTKNSEILEAERASDEKRDIMSRMIGAEIRYARLGYWNRQAPIGFVNVKAETIHGRRVILEPHPIESQWIIKMFELRCRGNMSDKAIVREINKLGFRTRAQFRRDRSNPMRILSKKGDKLLTVKRMHCLLKNPTYAGVNNEVWLLGESIRYRFNGLVSYDVFNRANCNKIILTENNGVVSVIVPKGSKQHPILPNPLYPYKSVVACPVCRRPLFGSASRGHSGKVYPAYHCGTQQRVPKHYFRVPIQQFHSVIERFVSSIAIAPSYTQTLIEAVIVEQKKRQAEQQRDTEIKKLHTKDLKAQARLIIDRIRFCSPSTIKYLEADLQRIEAEMASARQSIQEKKGNLSVESVRLYASHFIARPELLLFDQTDMEQKAHYFGLLFEEAASYYEITSRSKPEKLSPLFTIRRTRPRKHS